ncbi:hypothetical protein C8A01DRAFT_17895 [Parachaetomium inaequale]|uniref:WSC domain-containing protein n=1 Tax=Parachaetomium inaequale TaxID=2588326 RepID=A0AAN6SQ16_9PEZI|nr:hypothetical protein C8A01DRAFT_17895 [Parachaetomium inaequale]
MASQRSALVWASFTIAALLCSMVLAQQTLPQGPSVPTEYCSDVNTADMAALYSDYQSDGRCSGNCTDLKYALAIVHAKNCWCSNLIPNPADQKPLRDCQNPCPGYPSDYCGGNELFGYMEAAGGTPTGTAPAGGTATKSPSSTTSNSESKPPTMTTITVGGTVRTVTASSEPTAPNDSAMVDNTGTGLQAGAIAGIVIGVVGGLAVVAAFIWFLFAKRRRQDEGPDNGLGSPIRSGSSPGRMATPKSGEVSENRLGGAPGGPVGATWDSQNKRRSHLMPIDPRLDPFATGIYPGDHNRSRESFNSLQDNQDYSRRVHQAPKVLRAMNPDPDD